MERGQSDKKFWLRIFALFTVVVFTLTSTAWATPSMLRAPAAKYCDSNSNGKPDIEDGMQSNGRDEKTLLCDGPGPNPSDTKEQDPVLSALTIIALDQDLFQLAVAGNFTASEFAKKARQSENESEKTLNGLIERGYFTSDGDNYKLASSGILHVSLIHLNHLKGTILFYQPLSDFAFTIKDILFRNVSGTLPGDSPFKISTDELQILFDALGTASTNNSESCIRARYSLIGAIELAFVGNPEHQKLSGGQFLILLKARKAGVDVSVQEDLDSRIRYTLSNNPELLESSGVAQALKNPELAKDKKLGALFGFLTRALMSADGAQVASTLLKKALNDIDSAAQNTRELLAKQDKESYASIFTIDCIARGYGAALLHHSENGPIAIVMPDGVNDEKAAVEMIMAKLGINDYFIVDSIHRATEVLDARGYGSRNIRLYTTDPQDKQQFKNIVSQIIVWTSGSITDQNLAAEIEKFAEAYAAILTMK